jgi:hypothetical protein
VSSSGSSMGDAIVTQPLYRGELFKYCVARHIWVEWFPIRVDWYTP